MPLTLGAHVGQQNMDMATMRATWRRLDAAGMDWISVWDHLYEAPPAGGTLAHYEALSTLGALCVETTNARIGCLVFYIGYRNPGLLAKAAVTLDHLSGGRFELGLGAGWHEQEAAAFGYDFPPLGTRFEMLEEGVQLIRSLLTQERTTFEGRHYRADDASCLPPPVGGRRLPIWIGGVGPERTPRLAARYADGWNGAYIGPEDYRKLNATIDRRCEDLGRDPASLDRTVNLMFMLAADEAGAAAADQRLDEQWGPMAARVRNGALMGTAARAAETIAKYVEAGARGVNIALRAPWDDDALSAYLGETIPALRKEFTTLRRV
ncbi:MAG: LLM class flavin-dependent oxidoreductase [Acidimicrobiia bacterium]|nr:LLM class flavin-dependent oxidoreductase [Acidimicrobiia bacterium]